MDRESRSRTVFASDNSLFALLSQLARRGRSSSRSFTSGRLGQCAHAALMPVLSSYFWSGRAKLGRHVFYNRFSDEIEIVGPGGLAQLGVPADVVAQLPFGAVRQFIGYTCLWRWKPNLNSVWGMASRLAPLIPILMRGAAGLSPATSFFLPSIRYFPIFLLAHFSPLVGNRPFNRAPHVGSFIWDMRGKRWRSQSAATLLAVETAARSFLIPPSAPPCFFLIATWPRLIRRSMSSGSYRLNRYLATLFRYREPGRASITIRRRGFPALPFNFRGGIKLTLGGEPRK